ncbi:MAG: metallophosphatase domain-containing protein [Prevotellaceae bacterium]|nr:metallophosphatase domain-containing protein [Prevotellaceae bacterium]
MTILQISDTHNRHGLLTDLPAADVIVHCGDLTDLGTEAEVLDFLNWFIALPHLHKLFVTGNHDLCLWNAVDIEDLPQGVHFLQDRSCEIDGVKFFGLAYNHSVSLIPTDTDVLVTHEPPALILDVTMGMHWGNEMLRERVFQVKPRYHLFGHAHEGNGTLMQAGILFSNGSVLDNGYRAVYRPRLFRYK